ncbi:MAG TPA: GNAT family N-acetyltransferase [Mycobacteriales bacterium]|nr:GNAT family N-acetyltransferase [Mycobacteriales bacterium]
MIREMDAAESDVVGALLLRCNEEHRAHFPPAVAASYLAEVADVARRVDTCDVVVAERGGRLVGSATLVRDAADDGHPWPAGGAVLRLLAVDPPARGAGLGEALTLACISRARTADASYVGLHTAAFMTAARHVYERLGFARAPEHDFDPDAYYGAGPQAGRAPWGLAYLLTL